MIATHDFSAQLAFSHAAEDSDIWPRVYAEAFPGLQSMTSTRQDGQSQRYGIDRTITLASGRAIYIDEKVRSVDYGDVLLEYVDNDRRGSAGWAEKPLFCDYIAYAIIPSRRCYLLPVPQLQLAWAKNKSDWLLKYGTRSARNMSYSTLNCPVPVAVLYPAIGDALRVKW